MSTTPSSGVAAYTVPVVPLRPRLRSVRFWAVRRALRSRWVALPRIIRTKATLSRLDAVTAFGILTALPISLFPVLKGTVYQPKEVVFIGVWVGILFLRWLHGLARSGAHGEAALQSFRKYATHLSREIHKCQLHGLARAAGEAPWWYRQSLIPDLLKGITGTARAVLGTPAFVEMHSNLMEQMQVAVRDGPARPGLGITFYDNPPAHASWSRVVVGDIGAGEAFEKRRVVVVEDTHEPIYNKQLLAGRARCWASFPVTDADGTALAVVNVDADYPYVLTKPICRGILMDAITPYLKLLGDVLRLPVPVSGGQAP